MLFASAKRSITPKPSMPCSLLGYFDIRLWTDVRDELIVQAVVVASDAPQKHAFVLVQYDLGVVPLSFVQSFRAACVKHVAALGRTTITLTATHTHTAPDIVPGDEPVMGEKHGGETDEGRVSAAYVEYALQQGVDAVAAAVAALQPGAFCETAYVREPGFAFNRRFWVQEEEDAAVADGKRKREPVGASRLPKVPRRVLTNPPRDVARRALIAASEGLVDMHVPVAGLCDASGALRVVLPNIALHADTVGGTGVSADWPGFLRRKIEDQWGVACLPLIGASGNINHFDVDDPGEQYGYEVARAIGEGYARAIIEHGKPGGARPSASAGLVSAAATFSTGPREIAEAELEEARQQVARLKDVVQERPLTSEDLALGVPAALKFNAERTLMVAQDQRAHSYSVSSFFAPSPTGGVLLLCLPGEPFTEMVPPASRPPPAAPVPTRGAGPQAMGLKSEFARRGRSVLVVSHCSANIGYVPNRECFGEGRGGYEVSPMSSPHSVDTATHMRSAARGLARDLIGRGA